MHEKTNVSYRLLQKIQRLFRFAVTTEDHVKNFTIASCFFVCRVTSVGHVTQYISKDKQNLEQTEKNIYLSLCNREARTKYTQKD